MDRVSVHRSDARSTEPAGPRSAPVAVAAGPLRTPATHALHEAAERLNAAPRVAALQRLATRIQPPSVGDGVIQAKWARQPDSDQVFVDPETHRTFDAVTRRLTTGGASSQVVRELSEEEANALLIEILAEVEAGGAVVDQEGEVRNNANDSVSVVANQSPQSESSPRALIPAKTIDDFLKTKGVGIDNYLAPPVKRAPGKKAPLVKQEEVDAFNTKLAKLAGLDIAVGPFVVTIVVGDLKGSGDIMAGAKLARELQGLYAAYEPWRDVVIYLHLLKEIDEDTASNVRKVAGDAVRIGNGEDAEHAGDHVKVSYPVHSADGDFKVQQYGYQRLGSDEAGYGSGPGFGSLGVLSSDPATVNKAVEQAEDPSGSANLTAIHGVLNHNRVGETSFAYFSIYGPPVKSFAKLAAERPGNGAIGIVFARAAASLDNVADSLFSLPNIATVKIVEIHTKGGAPRVGAEVVKLRPVPKKRGAAVSSAQRTVVLVNLPDGIQNSEVMSMYFGSSGLVGATGDQSFLEAYRMRSLKEQRGGIERADNKIMYDVPEQQIQLMTHIGELQSGYYASGNESLGLKTVDVHPNVMQAIDTKPLVVPMVMLINEQVLAKRDERD